MHTIRFNILFKRWVQFRVGAIPRLLVVSTMKQGFGSVKFSKKCCIALTTYLPSSRIILSEVLLINIKIVFDFQMGYVQYIVKII